MRSFRDIPIKQKLMVITMATTTVALLLAAIGIVAFDAFLFRQSLTRDLSALSRIIADNSTAALAFNDPRAATETLAALRARPTWPPPVSIERTDRCWPNTRDRKEPPYARCRTQRRMNFDSATRT